MATVYELAACNPLDEAQTMRLLRTGWEPFGLNEEGVWYRRPQQANFLTHEYTFEAPEGDDDPIMYHLTPKPFEQQQEEAIRELDDPLGGGME